MLIFRLSLKFILPEAFRPELAFYKKSEKSFGTYAGVHDLSLALIGPIESTSPIRVLALAVWLLILVERAALVVGAQTAIGSTIRSADV